MKFSDFVGNRDVINRLKNQVRFEKTFHSYIFDGADGIGKKRLAYTLAQAILCRHLSEGGEPCGVCNACKKVLSQNHGDIHYITTDGSSIKDEQVEEMQQILFSKPFDADRTILIIDDADTMTQRAQNRLLKTLEEPAGSVTVMLLTKKISDVLPTIVSRSAVIRLKPVDRELIKDFLIKQIGVAGHEAQIAAAYSYGSPGRAVRLINDESFISKRESSIECACGLIEKKSLLEFAQLFEEYNTSKENILDFLEMMSFWYRDLLLISQNMDESLLMNCDKRERLRELSKKTNLKQVCKILEQLEKTKYDIMMNVNINYALKNMYLEIN